LKKTYYLLRVISIIFGISIAHVWADNSTLNFQILNYTHYSTIYDESTRNDKLGVPILVSVSVKDPAIEKKILDMSLAIGGISPSTGRINSSGGNNQWNILLMVASEKTYYTLNQYTCNITSDDFASGKPVRIFIYRTNLSSGGAYSAYIEPPVSSPCKSNLGKFITSVVP
jgi:hypothetical protein